MFRAEAVASQMINTDPDKYGHHVLDEAEFEDTYAWMLGHAGLVEPGSTYESVVDNRAWE